MFRSHIPFLFTALSYVVVPAFTSKVCMRAYSCIGEHEGGHRMDRRGRGKTRMDNRRTNNAQREVSVETMVGLAPPP